MKISKTALENIKTAGLLFGGMLVGSMVSEGLVGVFHKPEVSTDQALVKKNNRNLLLKRGAVVVGSGIGAVSIESKEPLMTFLKGACYGSATTQGVKMAQQIVKSNNKISTLAAKNSFTKHAVGLACPCTIPTPTLNRPVRLRAMRGPANVYPPGLAGNPLERAIEKGRMRSAA